MLRKCGAAKGLMAMEGVGKKGAGWMGDRG